MTPSWSILHQPMSGLDPIGRRLVRNVILDLKKAGKTVVFSTISFPTPRPSATGWRCSRPAARPTEPSVYRRMAPPSRWRRCLRGHQRRGIPCARRHRPRRPCRPRPDLAVAGSLAGRSSSVDARSPTTDTDEELRMQRRFFLLVAALADPLTPAYAHHGWSGFDQDRPLYPPRARRARSRGATRTRSSTSSFLPISRCRPTCRGVRCRRSRRASTARGCSPTRACRRARTALWTSGSAPLTRMEQWKVSEIRNGEPIEVLGYTTTGEKGDPVLRAEYLFAGGHADGLRSSPA